MIDKFIKTNTQIKVIGCGDLKQCESIEFNDPAYINKCIDIKIKNQVLQTNYKYTVDKITKDNFTLFNKIDKEYFIVPRKMIYESFTLPFCSTIESIQGKTINDDITIFDLDSNYMSKN